MAEGRDWHEWHAGYADPTSLLSIRLTIVQARLQNALDSAPPGPLRLISACAGQGRDVIGALARHPRRGDVTARLVELDPDLAATARTAAAAAQLPLVEVVTGDAGTTDAYVGVAPADLVLVCGVFGNVSDEDIRTTVDALPSLCRPGATVIWTRHRRPPDRTVDIRRWFAAAGFDEVAFDRPDAGGVIGVGTHRLAGPAAPLRTGVRLFTFV